MKAVLGGLCLRGGGVDWGEGSKRGNLRSQGQALVHHGLPLPPLARPLTIPGFNIGTMLVGKAASSGGLQQQTRYALKSG